MFEQGWNMLEKTDNAIADIIARERDRQDHGIELIASENFVSPAVLCAMGSILTNKYAEGYPAHRYYGGRKSGTRQSEEALRVRPCERTASFRLSGQHGSLLHMP